MNLKRCNNFNLDFKALVTQLDAELLVKLLLKHKEYEKMKKWAEEGARLYPNRFPLKKLQNRLKTE